MIRKRDRPRLDRFIQHVESNSLNGIVGDVRNFFAVDAGTLMESFRKNAFPANSVQSAIVRRTTKNDKGL